MSAQHRPSARLEKILSILRQDADADRYRALLAVNHRAQELVANGQSRTPGLSEAFRYEKASILRRMMLADQDGYVEDDLLPKLDRASMAASLEARVPMLDHEVIELSWSLPDHVLARRRRGKWILREILSSFVPSHVIDRPKMGFSVPVESWLRGPLREWAGDLLAPDSVSRAGLMVPEAVQHEWGELVDRGRGSALAVWSMAMLQAWWETWCADRLPTGHPL
jgi:asparagine synthase (glutamine-hydrolysing)